MRRIVYWASLILLAILTAECTPKENLIPKSTVTIKVPAVHVNGKHLVGDNSGTPFLENKWPVSGFQFQAFIVQEGQISPAGIVNTRETNISEENRLQEVTVDIPVPQNIKRDQEFQVVLVDDMANSSKNGGAIVCPSPLKRGIGRVPAWYVAEVGAGFTSVASPSYLMCTECLYITNKTATPIMVKHEGYVANNKWYFTNADIRISTNPSIAAAPSGKTDSGESVSPAIEIKPGETGFIISSFAPNGKKLTDASLVMEIDGQQIQTVPVSSDVDFKNGQPYFINVVWDGYTLEWSNGGSSQDDTTVRNYQKNDNGTVLEMGEKTIYVRSDVGQTLHYYDEQEGIISFDNSETLEGLDIKVGDYLYSNEETKEFPDGYCFLVTDIKTKSTKGSGTTEFGVQAANILDAIEYYKDRVDVAWDKMDASNVRVYNVLEMPDLETIGNIVLGPDAFSKKEIGNGLSVKPGIRKTVIEYVIWQQEGKSQAGYGEVKHANMKLVIEATIDHDLYNGITFELDHGKLLFDSDLECGISFCLKFQIDGKNFNKEELTKEERKEFLKQFEATGSRVIGRQVQICSIDLPMGAASVILRPKFDILWDFRVEKIAGEFSFTIGYVGAKYNMHFENRMPGSVELVGEPLTCIQKPEWIMDLKGKIEGTIATGPAIGITVEVPGLRYSGEYRNVRKWKNYKGRTIPAFVGAYLELLLEGTIKLQSDYNILTSRLLTQIVLSSKLRLDAFEEHLIGLGKLLVGHDQKRANVWTWDLGDYTYELYESDAQEYCISPKVGSYIPEGESVLLEWGSSRTNASSLVYDLYLGTNENVLSAVRESSAETWYRLKASKPDKYYWKVVARTPSGQKFESDTWFFTIGDPPGQTNVILPIGLGLPSGLTWGDRNLGADKNSDSGLYFSWGGTRSVSGTSYWNNYLWSDGTESVMTKYNLTDQLTILERDDDAASVNSERKGWRMPTREDWQELVDNCSWTLGERNGVSGFIVKNDETEAFVFIPIITDYIGQYGKATSHGAIYWTSSRSILNNVSLANAVEITASDKLINKVEPRYMGFMVRPVFDGNEAPGLATDQKVMEFGGVAISTSKPMHLTITNVGYSLLYMQATSITAPFSCNKYQESIVLEPGHSFVFTVQFSPEALGDYEGKLLLSSNAPGGVVPIQLKGTGITKSDGGIEDVPGTNL